MRVLVCGGREVSDSAYVWRELDVFHAKLEFTVVIEGDARGADRLAGAWARARGIETLTYPADWSRYGKRAGYVRNTVMLQEGKPDLVIAFPGGKGTANMVHQANTASVPVRLINGLPNPQKNNKHIFSKE